MPLRNRVDPLGEIVAVPHRGTVFGNRGLLHDSRRRIVRHSRVDRWICCRLEFRGRRRPVMAPGRYTELFFLDEATALAAGHRPCAECRHRDYQLFRTAWADALGADRPGAGRMDRRLAAERGRTWPARMAELPDGVMVLHRARPHLVLGGRLLPWDWTGYGDPLPPSDPGATTEVITAPTLTATLRAGFRVTVHPSANSRSAARSENLRSEP